MAGNSKKNKGTSVRTLLRISVPTIAVAVLLSCLYLSRPLLTRYFDNILSSRWEQMMNGNTQGWGKAQYIDAILSAPGIKSRSNKFAVLKVQQTINAYRLQYGLQPIPETGKMTSDLKTNLGILPLDNLHKLSSDLILAIEKGDIIVKYHNAGEYTRDSR